MSKKLIALVLFVSMLLMAVPFASAAPANYQLQINDGLTWFLYGSTAVDFTNTAFEVAATSTSVNGVLYVDIKADYSDLNQYYYNYYGTPLTNPFGTAFKVPFAVVDPADSNLNVTEKAMVNNIPAYFDRMYSAVAPSNANYIYYLTAPLTENNETFNFRVTVDGQVFTVIVRWTNTENVITGGLAKLKFASKEGVQKDNFLMDANDMYWSSGSLVKGRLNFRIPKTSSTENNTIMRVADSLSVYTVTSTNELAANFAAPTAPVTMADAAFLSNYYWAPRNLMTVKLQAISGDGTLMVPGTTVSVNSFTAMNQAAGYTGTTDVALTSYEKVNLLRGSNTYAAYGNVDVIYFLDANSCFVLNIPGIKSWDAYAGATVVKYFETMFNVKLSFLQTYQSKVENMDYDVYFYNTARTTSGITVLEEETLVLVTGETKTISTEYTVQNALTNTFSWKSVKPSIVTVTTAGKLTAKDPGTTLVYAEDATGATHILNIIVVATQEEKDALVNPPATEEPNEEPGEEPTTTEPTTEIYVVTASALNIRKGPGTSYGKNGQYKRGVEVEVVSLTGSWALLTDGTYVSAKYLAKP